MKGKICGAGGLLAVIICLIIGIAARNHYEDSGISGIHTVEELAWANVCLERGLGYMEHTDAAVMEARTYEYLQNMQNEQVEILKKAPVILRVRPTEQIETAGESLKQYFVVTDVIRGEEYVRIGQEAAVSSSLDRQCSGDGCLPGISG